MNRYVSWVGIQHVIIAMAVAACLLVAGCGHNHSSITIPKPSAPSTTAPPITVDSPISSSKTPVKSSLIALLEKDAQTDHVFPRGVVIKSVKLQDGVASIDFSHEFAELTNSGESVESDAQHALRNTLAKFPSIAKMRVTVEGKPFESQATDWYTPFSVRTTAPEVQDRAPSAGPDSASR